MGNSPAVYEVWRRSASEGVSTWQLYVGSDNTTGLLDTALLYRTLGSLYDAYTVTMAEGVWQGEREHSAIVTITGTQDEALKAARKLVIVLGQDAVGLVRTGDAMVMVDVQGMSTQCGRTDPVKETGL